MRREESSSSSEKPLVNVTLRYPVRMHLRGYDACPIKFGSPNMSSSCTRNRIRARSGLATSNSHMSFHIGLMPLSAANGKTYKNRKRLSELAPVRVASVFKLDYRIKEIYLLTVFVTSFTPVS